MRGVLRVVPACFFLLASLASAQFNVRANGASVFLNEQPILTLRAANAGKRAQTVVASFKKLTPESSLQIEKTDGVYQILDGDRVVITITAAEAKAQKTAPETLASQWKRRIEKAMNAQGISVGVDRLKMGPGSKKTVAISGYLAKSAKAQTDRASAATATISKGQLVVQAKALGEATITISAGEVSRTIQVFVLPAAMSFPQSLSVSLTGDPVSADTIRSAVEGVLWTRLQASPSATFTFKTPAAQPLAIDRTAVFAVPVSASGPGVLDANGTVDVTVKVEPIAFRAEGSLWYCNFPENVRRPENLFAARLKKGDPVRMLYHHINDTHAGLYMHVQAVNESDQPARVQIIPGDSAPDKNPVWAGIQAADQLLRNWLRNSGEVVTIPPRSTVPIMLRRTAPQETVSGLCYLRLVSGPANLLVRTDAYGALDLDPRSAAALDTSTPWRRMGPSALGYEGFAKLDWSEHVYPTPFKTETVDYHVGGRHGFFRLGQKPIPRADGKGLDGNFGVFYTLETKMENPTGEAADVEIVFEASAGYSGALFAMNGEVLRTPLLQPKEEIQILRVKLQPGEKRAVSLLSVPLSGSSYPATVAVRPVGSGASPTRVLPGGGFIVQ